MEVSVAHLPASTERLHQYRTVQAKDPTCLSDIHHCQNGWPKKSGEAELNCGILESPRKAHSGQERVAALQQPHSCA